MAAVNQRAFCLISLDFSQQLLPCFCSACGHGHRSRFCVYCLFVRVFTMVNLKNASFVVIIGNYLKTYFTTVTDYMITGLTYWGNIEIPHTERSSHVATELITLLCKGWDTHIVQEQINVSHYTTQWALLMAFHCICSTECSLNAETDTWERGAWLRNQCVRHKKSIRRIHIFQGEFHTGDHISSTKGNMSLSRI